MLVIPYDEFMNMIRHVNESDPNNGLNFISFHEPNWNEWDVYYWSNLNKLHGFNNSKQIWPYLRN